MAFAEELVGARAKPEAQIMIHRSDRKDRELATIATAAVVRHLKNWLDSSNYPAVRKCDLATEGLTELTLQGQTFLQYDPS